MAWGLLRKQKPEVDRTMGLEAQGHQVQGRDQAGLK